MDQGNDDFKRLSEKYGDELMDYYRRHRPSVLAFSDNTRRSEPNEFERDRVAEQRINKSANAELHPGETEDAARDENMQQMRETPEPLGEISPQGIRLLPLSPMPEFSVQTEIPMTESDRRSRDSNSEGMPSDTRTSPERGEHVGFIKVAVSTAQQAVPLPGSKVTIASGEEHVDFYAELQTDISGNTPVVTVPAPSRTLSQTPGGTVRPYYRYSIDVELPGYDIVNITDVPVFEGILSLQPVSMVPASGGGRITTDTPGFPL